MNQDMNKLISQRGLAMGSIKRTMAFAQNPPNVITAEQIGTRLSRLESVWNELSQYTQDLYAFKDDKNFVDPEEEFFEYEDMYMNAQGLLKTLLAKVSKPELPPQKESQITPENLKKLESPATVSYNIDNDLPNIIIEQFAGRYKDWPIFEKLYKKAIESKPHWTNSQKFYYLTTLLRGDAGNLIKHIQISDTSYSTAWNILKVRFDRPRYIVNSYIEAFMTLPTLKDENVHGLRRIIDVSKEVVTGLDDIGKSGRDHWLIYILESKLDPESRRKWTERSRNDDMPTLSTFFSFLNQSSEELLHRGKHYSQGVLNRPNSTPKGTKPTKAPSYCYDCGSADHLIFTCPHFTSLSVEQRLSLVKAKSLCSYCLNRGHSANICWNRKADETTSVDYSHKQNEMSEIGKRKFYKQNHHKRSQSVSTAFTRKDLAVGASNASVVNEEVLSDIAAPSRYVTQRLLQKKRTTTRYKQNAAGAGSNDPADNVNRSTSTHSLLTTAIRNENPPVTASNNHIPTEKDLNHSSPQSQAASDIPKESAASTASNNEENVENKTCEIKSTKTSSENIALTTDYYVAIPF